MIKLPGWTKSTEISQENTGNSKKFWNEFQLYTQAIWKRITNWKNYPLDYINLHESLGIYTLYHFKNNLLIYKQDIIQDDPGWKEYIEKYSSTPVCFLVQGQDCEFRLLPTNQIQIWDRFFLFNQIKTNEFNPDDLVGHYRTKHLFEKTDIFISIRTSEELLQIFKTLASLKNPINGVLSWDLEQSLVMKKNACSNLRAWCVTVVPIDTKNCTILIFHHEKILLQRVISIKNAEDLERELSSTLRFLQRQGYKEGQAVSILIPENVEIQEFSNATLELIRIQKKFLEKDNYKPNKPFLNFSPKTLFQAKLSHELPKLCIKFLIPLSLIFLVFWASVQIKSFFEDYEKKWLKTQYEKIHNKIPKNFNAQMHLSKFFPLYLENSINNPLKLMGSIHKLLKDKAQISFITWDLSDHKCKLYFKSSNANKKSADLKKYIDNNAERMFGKVILTWEENDKDLVLIIQQQEKSRDN